MEHADQESLLACPICGRTDPQVWGPVLDHSVSKEPFTLVDCVHCGFRFTSPRPRPNTIGRYYASEEYISHSNTRKGFVASAYQRVRAHALRKKVDLVKRLQPKGRVLDVGCGTGEFLAELKQNQYLVQGVEPEVKAREQAIANHALSVLPKLQLVEAREQFQVITLWHVLEHLHDLRGSMKQLFARTAEDGVLMIAVPDRGSWDSDHYGENWAAYDVPRHLWHFRQQDVRRLLHEHGFELMESRRMPFDAFYIAILSERYRGHSLPVALVLALLKGAWSNLVALATGRPTSSTLYIARKARV